MLPKDMPHPGFPKVTPKTGGVSQCLWGPMIPEVSLKRHAMSPGVPKATPAEVFNPYLQPPSPWQWVPRERPWVLGGSVAHLSGSVAATEVVLLGKPAGHRPRQLRLLQLHQGQQCVGRPLDVVGMGVAFLPALPPWGDICPSAPPSNDLPPPQLTRNYLSPPCPPPGFVPPVRRHLWNAS